jgi:hypothetical protein
MPSWTERQRIAQRHVSDGQRVIQRQRALIHSQRKAGRDTTDAEEMLASFERTQVVLEDHLARIVAERE